MSSSGKKLSTFEFLFSWQNRTFLLTENQRTLLRSQCSYIASTFSLFFSAAFKLLLGFSQQLQKRAKIQMFSTPCRTVTSLRLSFFLKSLRLYLIKNDKTTNIARKLMIRHKIVTSIVSLNTFFIYFSLLIRFFQVNDEAGE